MIWYSSAVEIIRLEGGPTEREVAAYVESFSRKPWREGHDPNTVREHLASYHDRPDSVVYGVCEAEDADPFLYVNARAYDDTSTLLEEEFTGSRAFYPAMRSSRIAWALGRYDRVAFVSGIFADRTQPVGADCLPRRRALPAVLADLANTSDARALAFRTHKDTKVFKEPRRNRELRAQFDHEYTPYWLHPRQSNSGVRRLGLFILTRNKHAPAVPVARQAGNGSPASGVS